MLYDNKKIPCPYCNRIMAAHDGIIGATYRCRPCGLTIDTDDIRTAIYDE